MGSKGQPAARDTRCRETFPAVSHGKGASPPRAPRSPTPRPPGPALGEVPGGRPWEAGPPTFLLLTTLAPAGSSPSLPPTSAPPGDGWWGGDGGGLGNFWLQPGSDSRCAQLGSGRPQIPGVDGKQAGDLYLPEEMPAEPRALPEADRRAGEVQWGGRGSPSHASPQAGFSAACRR